MPSQPSPQRPPTRWVPILALFLCLAAIGIGLVAFRHYRDFGPDTVSPDIAAKSDINGLKTGLLVYKGSTGSYPTTEQGLKALVEHPGPPVDRWRKARERLDNDPWGHPYQYLCPGIRKPHAYDIFSLGRDGKPSEDDIYPE